MAQGADLWRLHIHGIPEVFYSGNAGEAGIRFPLLPFCGWQCAEGCVDRNGQPIRFWSGSDYNWRTPFKDKNLSVSPTEKQSVAHHVRWAAKRGINMVRFHGHLPPKSLRGGLSPSREDINKSDLHGAWYMVAAFKKAGVYSTISPYWGSHTDNETGWDLGFKGGNLTGIALKDDPALAIIQLQNEDSLLFYTEAQIKGKPREQLLRMFGDFLKKKYGSLEKAFERYTSYESGWDLRGEDSVEKGTAGLLQMWFFTQDARDRAKRWDEKTRYRKVMQLEGGDMRYRTRARDALESIEYFE